MIELVVTDLDGTLWAYGSEGVPHARTLAAWVELDRRGVPVLVATGRRVTTTREPLAALGLAPSAVVLDGALALDLATGHRFHRHNYDTDTAVGVLAYCELSGIDPARVLAIGDGSNDRELLANAAIALVPEDAHEEALSTARHVVPSPAVGGWAAILDCL
jgi:hydroxymethylpyrimidine pyrophosphatase-like HAD family hydrolase